MDKFGRIVGIGYKVVATICAGYFVHRVVEERVQELAEDGGALNALAVGVGEGAVLTAVCALVYAIV